METKICTRCKKELPLSEYYSRGNGRYRSECKECHKNYVKLQYNIRKDKTNDIKANCGCQKCGDTRFYVLDFHHKDPTIKDERIALLTSNTSQFEKIENEIKKCVVLCANCHREFHYLEKHDGITIDKYLS